jgi:hypothetical protein
MANKTITYTTKRGEKVTVDADSKAGNSSLWIPAYHLADLMLAECEIVGEPKAIRSKFVGNIRASMSALHAGFVTAGDVDKYKKVKKVPSNLKALIQLDKFDYAFKKDGIDITEYPMFLVAENTTKKTTKKTKTTSKRKAATVDVHKPNGFGNSVKISATDPIDASEKQAKFDAFIDMAAELGIDLAALSKS